MEEILLPYTKYNDRMEFISDRQLCEDLYGLYFDYFENRWLGQKPEYIEKARDIQSEYSKLIDTIEWLTKESSNIFILNYNHEENAKRIVCKKLERFVQ